MPVTHSPSAEGLPGRVGAGVRWLRSRVTHAVPHSLQARLTLAYVGVTALTLALVSTVVVNRLDAYFQDQVRTDLEVRSTTVRTFVSLLIDAAVDRGGGPVVAIDGSLNTSVAATLSNSSNLSFLTQLAQADLEIRIGSVTEDIAGGRNTLTVSPGGTFKAQLQAQPRQGQARDPIDVPSNRNVYTIASPYLYGLEITLANPYTYRASTLATVTSLLLIVAIIALLVAMIVAAALAQRFASPLRRLTDASRALAEGDLGSRVPGNLENAGSAEIAALSRQFNAMAARLEETMEIIRRDRDRSRDFLADVSHELRTPLAALRTFNELLREGAQNDPEARDEFLASSAQQLERLDWLAQNLLELSKLDSGLVLLDLRPEDLRATVESAVQQTEPTASRREIALALELPDRPVRIRHDPQRLGQVVTNLVGNALKFTARGGAVKVVVRAVRQGAEVSVSDTGVGIDASELPRIFERFYRGSQANEARSSGSGLGLAIVRSIVDMHRGRVSVVSTVGHGSTFTVFLPADPRTIDAPAVLVGADVPPAEAPLGPGGLQGRELPPTEPLPKMADSSPTAESRLNPPASI